MDFPRKDCVMRFEQGMYVTDVPRNMLTKLVYGGALVMLLCKSYLAIESPEHEGRS